MTTAEFSNEFDTLVSSYLSKTSFGSQDALAFDEYEKSVFLTEAQEKLVLSLYNGANSSSDSFESTEEIRRYLSSLITTVSLLPESSTTEVVLSTNSKVFDLPEDLWFITYESATLSSDSTCLNGKEIEVTPVSQDAFHKTMSNPFKGPNQSRALRLDLHDNKVELVSKYTISAYLVRYVKKVTPIILVDLSEGLQINGVNSITECSLAAPLHRRILEYAVKLALTSKGVKLNNN